MKSAIIGVILALLINYAFGALVAWDLNPANWGLFWRLWCSVWTILWCIVAGSLGAVMQGTSE